MDRPQVAANLDAVRHAELQAAAAIIGYHKVIMLGYRDSGMPGSDDNARNPTVANQQIGSRAEPE